MTNAISGIGAGLYREDQSTPDTFVKLAEVNNIDGPNITADTIDVTSFDTAKYREFIAGYKDGGEVTGEMNFTNATYKQAFEDFNAGTIITYQVKLADTLESYVEFDAVMVGLTLGVPTDDKVTSTATFKVSGEPTFGDNS